MTFFLTVSKKTYLEFHLSQARHDRLEQIIPWASAAEICIRNLLIRAARRVLWFEEQCSHVDGHAVYAVDLGNSNIYEIELYFLVNSFFTHKLHDERWVLKDYLLTFLREEMEWAKENGKPLPKIAGDKT